MIKIAHASISENNDAGRNGKAIAGDQTGKEVCVRNYYTPSYGWGMVLRHPTEKIAYEAANIAQLLCASNKVGYDQTQRNTLHDEMKKYNYSVSDYLSNGRNTETDCSAFITLLFLCSGIKTLEYITNAPTTLTMEKVFKAAGFEVLKQNKFLKSDQFLRKGDVLLTPGHHTAICIESGARAYDAQPVYPTVRRGNNSPTVATLQIHLNNLGYGLFVDGDFGIETYKAVIDYQKKHNLDVDGIVGSKTWQSILNS